MDLFEEKKDCKHQVMDHAKSGGWMGAGLGVVYGIATSGMKKAGANNIFNNCITHGMNKGVFGATLMSVFAVSKYCVNATDEQKVENDIKQRTSDFMGFFKNFGKEDKNVEDAAKETGDYLGFMKSIGKDEQKTQDMGDKAKDILGFVKKIGKDDK